jgi:hypothetical protein
MIISKYLTPILTRICNKIWYLSNIFPNSLKEIVEKERIKLRKVNKGGETMKKLLTVLAGVVIALSLFVTTGNTVKAAPKPNLPISEGEHECGCDVSPVLGAEKNKIVADLLSSKEFKNAKHSLKSDGYRYRGADNIEVLINHTYGDIIMVGVPFYNEDGNVEMAAFFNGVYMDPAHLEN